jgi:alkanesulfonate monooxygenase
MIPTNDPFPLVPAMARETNNLSFAVTGNVSFEPPYLFARRFSTLDQLTKGRMGWNIVTGTKDTGARGMGRDGLAPHDDRYDIADEFMDVVYRLWEGSWEEDSVLWDKTSGVFARPEKVHPITFANEHFRVDGIHLTEPSPQRTPVLFQAGSSQRGRAFAAKHAECVFLSGPSPTVIARVVKDVRERASAEGRDPRKILFFPMATIIVGETEREARAKLEDYRRYISTEAAMVLFSGFTGIDFSNSSPNDTIEYMQSKNGTLSALEAFTIADPNRVWTVGEVAQHLAIGGRGPLFVGSAEQVADELQAWIEATDADGFNLAYVVTPETYVDIVDLLVPELQRRGAYKRRYATGTFREKLYGDGQRLLSADHPAAAVRVAPQPEIRAAQG